MGGGEKCPSKGQISDLAGNYAVVGTSPSVLEKGKLRAEVWT